MPFNLHICIVDGVSASFPYELIHSYKKISFDIHTKPRPPIHECTKANQHIPPDNPYMLLIMSMTQAFNKYTLLQTTKVQNPAQTPL